MSDTYHFVAINGKLTHEGDVSDYILKNATNTELEDIYKVYNFGPNGYCFHNDSNAYVKIPMKIESGKGYSIACYVMYKNSNNGTIGENYIVPLWDDDNGALYSIQLTDIFNRRPGCRIGGNDYAISANFYSQYNTWYHLMLTKDKNDVWRFFINGNLIGSYQYRINAASYISINAYDEWTSNVAQNLYMNDVFTTGTCLATKNFDTWKITKKVEDDHHSIAFPNHMYLYN